MAEEMKPGEQTASSTGDAQNKLQSSREHARKAAEDLKSAAGAFADEYRGKAEQALVKHAAKRNKLGEMPGAASARSRKMRSSTYAKIRQKRCSRHSESDSCWV